MILYPTLVLDKTYTPVTIFSHKKAFLLELLNKCEVLEHYERIKLHSPSCEFPAPLVIKIPVLFRHWQSSPTRRALFIRDNFTCAYCGKTVKDNEATVDHLVPKSRGGKWEWENLVTSCSECNQRKGNRTPKEAGMELLFKPKRPSTIQIALNRWKSKFNEEFLRALSTYGIRSINVSIG
ncbi:TIGR02646 family protein [Balnearium lithotrophicum]|uniref:TIGR02646 family protein n=1 Tax=Balnearium lithotrophicum TaxID=223788 RepID=A0A521CDJ8_9BACT|nr:HNH endonuclease [Balnearium lithotrophicum]SMO57483.1 TIGR02646 family protein [Balnearium lithotrophicum]